MGAPKEPAVKPFGCLLCYILYSLQGTMLFYLCKGLKVKRFAFVSDAAEREYKALPEDIQDEFGKDLRRIQYGQDPALTIEHLNSVGRVL